jgi:hypothetical protein
VRGIVRDAARNDYRFSSLVLGVVDSMPFQMRIRPPEAEPSTIGAERAGLADPPISKEKAPRSQQSLR